MSVKNATLSYVYGLSSGLKKKSDTNAAFNGRGCSVYNAFSAAESLSQKCISKQGRNWRGGGGGGGEIVPHLLAEEKARRAGATSTGVA